MRVLSTILCFGWYVAPAAAAVTEFSVMSMECPHDANLVVNQVKINFTGIFAVAESFIKLDEGTIFNLPANTIPIHQAPSQALIDILPVAECDTFVAQGSPTSGGPLGDPGIIGGAIDIGGGASPVFTDDCLSAAWGPAGGADISDQNGFLILQATMTKDAFGTARFVFNAEGVNASFDWFVHNGVITQIPEPATVALCGLALVGLVGVSGRRGRKWMVGS